MAHLFSVVTVESSNSYVVPSKRTKIYCLKLFLILD